MAQCAAPKTSDTIRESSRLRDREVPPAGGSRRGVRLRGTGDRGTCLTEGESFTPPMAEYFFSPWVLAHSAAHCVQCAKSHRQRQQNPFHAFTTLLDKQWDSLRNASIAITPGRATIHRSVAFSARSNPTLRCETKTKAPCSRCLCFRWRRRWDSNPRTGNPVN